MAAALDAYQSGGISQGASSLSWTHTPVGAPSKILLGILQDSTVAAPTAVTYGGNAMTLIGTNTAAYLTGLRVYELNSPPSGAQTVSITLSASSGRLGGGSVSLTGTTPGVTTNNTNHDGVPPTNTIASATGNVVVTFAAGYLSIDQIATPNNTGLWSDINSNASQAAQIAAGAASVTNSWSGTMAGETGTISVNVSAASSSGSLISRRKSVEGGMADMNGGMTARVMVPLRKIFLPSYRPILVR